ncbi:class I SAM-dependent methyltransferase [Demequina aurantiaca]|uniref:class I SAM-dependent methyltransferase n=1 Tax=Demequina aurantiaca TaxID=676200 RepID=UPI0007837BA9|nr:class I SAM-dependent methyltransferase [Demequina aurantiaca]
MRSFDDLVAEADAADVSGWGFGWLDGRATEERPPWGFARLLADRLATVDSALDLDTGGGEVLGEAPIFPPTMVATEGWPPNAARARSALAPRGVKIVDAVPGEALPFEDHTFTLVTARHPVAPDWPEIHRVLRPGGSYFAQHVGPASAFELIEEFLGPLVEERRGRDPDLESAAARDAGLEIVHLSTARCRMEFYDIGAVVWTLRKCVWWVPDFSVVKYDAMLRRLDAQMRAGKPVVAHSTRHLIEARRPS